MATWGWKEEFVARTPIETIGEGYTHYLNEKYLAKKEAEKIKTEEARLEAKAIKQGKTVEQIKTEEAEKAEQKRLKAKYRRYLKEVEELKKELARKEQFIKEYEQGM